MRSMARFVMLFSCGLAPGLLRAQSLPDSFTLGKYVPGDWWMYVHIVQNPEREWLTAKWTEVWDALSKTGIDKDILGLITSALSDEQRTKTDSAVTKVRELLKGVRWETLMAKELVIAERVAPPLPHYAMLARGSEGSGEKNAAGLAGILQYIASFIDKAQVAHRQQDGIDVWTVCGEGAKYCPHLFRKGDIIGLVTSQSTFDEVIGLVNGTSNKQPITLAPRFLEALKQIKAPEDSLLFFDTKMLVRDIDSFVDFGFAQQGKNTPDDEKGRKIVKAAVSTCDVFDYHIITSETNGRQEITHSVGRAQAEKISSPFAKACFQRKAFDRFDKYIPADATGFNLESFVDLGLMYKTVIDFVERNVPEGAKGIAEFKAGMAEVGFDLERDLFSWWSGEMITIEMPAAVVTPMGGGDSVFMVRVKDSQLAAQKVGAGVNWLKSILENQMGQTLLVNPNPSGLNGFTEITHPMIAMFLRPVWGVHEDWLILASSASGVQKCLDVASGKAPSILKNNRFQSEGLVPKGPVSSASFADTSNFAQELGQGLGLASMIGGMMTANIPTESGPEAKKVKDVMQKAFGILMKLSPVVAKIDFFSSESEVTVCEGMVSRGERVVTYKASGAGPKSADVSPKRD